jgi:hypothetical protein
MAQLKRLKSEEAEAMKEEGFGQLEDYSHHPGESKRHECGTQYFVHYFLLRTFGYQRC